jgi:PEP-CTERM motif
VGLSPSSDGVFQGVDRYAFQFNLAALPAGATVTQATLRLRDAAGAPNIFAYGFVGNGAFSAASVTTGTQLFQTQAGNSGPVDYDVSAFVESLAADVYAGFSLRQTGLDTIPPQLEGMFDSTQNLYSPQLTITYTTLGSSVPEPSTLALLASGLLGLGLLGGRRRKAA